MLHRFFVAPWVMHTPPPNGIVRAALVDAAFLRRAVPVARPPLNDLVDAALMTAQFARRTVRDANAPPAGDVRASLVAAIARQISDI